MPRTFIALDLETTGLDNARDAIIEVGAAKFQDDRIIDRYSTLINPGRPIPYEITQLTGITDRDVTGKPRFDQVASQITRFVGGAPVVGHNVSFDLGFLRGQGLLTENTGLDTWELSTILLPGRSGYSLGVLAEQFGLGMAGQHRALEDAERSGLLFVRLTEIAAKLPRAVLMEINRLAKDTFWSLADVFRDALIASGAAAPCAARPARSRWSSWRPTARCSNRCARPSPSCPRSIRSRSTTPSWRPCCGRAARSAAPSPATNSGRPRCTCSNRWRARSTRRIT